MFICQELVFFCELSFLLLFQLGMLPANGGQLQWLEALKLWTLLNWLCKVLSWICKVLI